MYRMNDVRADDTRNILPSIPLFKGLDATQLAWIAQRSHRRLVPAGKDIITIEQPGEAVYIILAGTVKIHVEQDDGRDVILSILGAGDMLGEMSIIDNVGRSASVVTLEDTLVLWMDKASFNQMMEEFPPVPLNLVRILSGRVRLSDELIKSLATLDVYGRVARELLAFAQKYGQDGQDGSVLIPIRLTQGDIADLVGASRKRVNQVMVFFREQEFVSTNADGKIVVLDRSALAKYCR